MEWNLSPVNSKEAWYRILISLLFLWILFGIGMFLEINNIFILSNLFFIFVGILVYLLIDAIIYLFISGDFDLIENKLLIVGSTMCLLVNFIVFYGFVTYF